MLPLMLMLATDPLPPEHPFNWLDRSLCPTAAGAEPFIPREAVLGAFLKKYPLTVSVDDLAGRQRNLAEAIALSNCPNGGCAPGNPTALRALSSAAEDMLMYREGANFRLVWASASPEPGTTRERVNAFYDLGRTDGYAVQCLQPGPPPTPPVSRNWTISVGATLADLEKPFSKRETASLSLRGDEVSDSEVGTVRGVISANRVLSVMDAGALIVGGGGYLAYERVTAADPAKAVNNLSLGLRATWIFDPGRNDPDAAYPTRLTLSGAWMTDDQGDSSAWRIQAGVRPGLGPTAFGTGYGHALSVWDSPETFLTWEWDLGLVVDYADVVDPGAKAALATQPEYLRWGYDLSGELRLHWWAQDPTIGLGVTYQYRDDLNTQGGRADRLTSRLKYYPSDSSNWAFGVEYDRGENLESLERIENWLLTVGYRR